MFVMEKEIREEPSLLSVAHKTNWQVSNKIAQKVKERNIRHIILSGRGSSDHAGIYFKYLCEIITGIPVTLAAPSVLTVYEGKLDLSNTLTIGVSQSGEAEDVLAILEKAKSQNSITVSVTNHCDSPLAQISDFHLDLCAGEEISVAATKTFVLEMYNLALIVASISNNADLNIGLQGLPEILSSVLQDDEIISMIASTMTDIQTCFVLGRGLVDAVTREIALKLQETSYIKAFGFALSDFLHGPFALIDSNSIILLLVPNDGTHSESLAMAKKLRQEGCRLVAITDDSKLDVGEKIVVPEVCDFIRPFIFACVGQLLACRISEKKGMNPDSPRGIKKITITK